MSFRDDGILHFSARGRLVYRSRALYKRALPMNYDDFLLADKPTLKTTTVPLDLPLMFADHEDIIEQAADFSVTEEFMAEMDMEDFSSDFEDNFPDYTAIAVCDTEAVLDNEPDFSFDRYAEFFLVVDTSEDDNPVLLWTGEGQFRTLFDSFEEFYESLTDWPLE